MRTLSISVRVAARVLGLAILLGFTGTAGIEARQARVPAGAQAAPLTDPAPSCTGVPVKPTAGPARAATASHPHSVTLSWNAALPTSNSLRDAISGYYVYRSLKSHAYPENSRISQVPLPGTRCVDSSVDAGETYFYTVKSVTEGAKQSSSSIEIRAVVPFP
jgi:hypothetical protein